VAAEFQAARAQYLGLEARQGGAVLVMSANLLKRGSNYLALAIMAAGVVVIASPVPASAASMPLTAVTTVSCGSKTHCWAGATYAKGSAIIATANRGATWSVEYTTSRFDAIAGLDCTSATHCVAIGYRDEGSSAAFLETTDGGKVWSTHASPGSLVLAETLSCANGSDCWAIGLAANRLDAAVAHSTDGGRTWASESIPALQTAMNSPFGISCASSTDCLATGEAALTTTNGGKTWRKNTVPDGVPLGPVACPSTTDCFAVFDVTSAVPSNEETFVFDSTDGGKTWKDVLSHPRHVAGLGGISCSSRATCVAVGYGYTPRRNGTDRLYGLSEFTSTGGKHWTESKLAQARYLLADSCVAKTRDCLAGGVVGARATILKSANDGATWTSEPLPRA
jgi:photosystem II stability/assembly factor-like uncharacterized protein